MSTTTAEQSTAAPEPSPQAAPGRERGSLLWAAIGSEWTKLRSARSTVYSLLATIAITIGFGALLSWAFVSRYDHLSVQDRVTFDATSHSLRGLFLSQLAIGVLGVLIISSEYTTGLIRPTFTAMPQRRTVLAAKTVVFGSVALVVAIVSCFSAFLIGQSILATKHIGVSLSDPHVFRAVCGGAAYLVFVGLLGLGLGRSCGVRPAQSPPSSDSCSCSSCSPSRSPARGTTTSPRSSPGRLGRPWRRSARTQTSCRRASAHSSAWRGSSALTSLQQ